MRKVAGRAITRRVAKMITVAGSVAAILLGMAGFALPAGAGTARPSYDVRQILSGQSLHHWYTKSGSGGGGAAPAGRGRFPPPRGRRAGPAQLRRAPDPVRPEPAPLVHQERLERVALGAADAAGRHHHGRRLPERKSTR